MNVVRGLSTAAGTTAACTTAALAATTTCPALTAALASTLSSWTIYAAAFCVAPCAAVLKQGFSLRAPPAGHGRLGQIASAVWRADRANVAKGGEIGERRR